MFGSSFQYQVNVGIFTQKLFLMVRQWFQMHGHAFTICHLPIRTEEDLCSIIVLGLKWSIVISLMLIYHCGLLALPRAAWLELQMACWAWQSVFCIFVCIWNKSLRDDRGRFVPLGQNKEIVFVVCFALTTPLPNMFLFHNKSDLLCCAGVTKKKKRLHFPIPHIHSHHNL